MNLELAVIDMGGLPFSDMMRPQRDYAQRHGGQGRDALFFASHTPTISLGISEKRNTVHLSDAQLAERGITLVQGSRAGGAAYLGPGQITAYPVLDIARLGFSSHPYLRAIEGMVAHVARSLGLPVQTGSVFNPTTGKDYHGVWHYDSQNKPHKLMAQGYRLSKNVISEGGFSVYHTAQAHEHFDAVNHCGFNLATVGATSFEELAGRSFQRSFLQQRIVDQFAQTFGYRPVYASCEEVLYATA